jgi:uncharacterized C2H2 Zn-finger protein
MEKNVQQNFCNRCQKVFPDKYKFKRHLLRKNLCKLAKNGENISYKKIWEKNFKDVSFNDYKKSKTPNDTNKNNNKLFICKNCGEILKHSSSYYRHIKSSCKIKSKLEEMKKEISEQNDLIHQLINLKKEQNIIYNTTNNTQNIFNQNNINISLNNFGEEDLSHITETFLTDIITHMNKMALIKYIQQVHFSNPSNTNIKLLDDKTKFMMIRKNNEWILDNKNMVLDGMINMNMNRIQQAYKILENKLEDEEKVEYRDYSNNKIEEIKEDTENMILSNQNSLKII